MELFFVTTDPELADLNKTVVMVVDDVDIPKIPGHVLVQVVGTIHMVMAAWDELLVVQPRKNDTRG